MVTAGVSIVLCTFNGKSRLAKTLMHLANQELNIPCEIVFVDNASSDGTLEFATNWWQKNGHSNISFHAYQQPIPGKSYAQDLGYAKANYQYLLVCDDDNWLCATYVQTAYNIMQANPNIGALGGWCDAAFESEKPKWFDQYAKYFAVAKQGTESGDITNKKGCLYGAGMVLQKQHWLELKTLGFKHMLSCRKGNKLSSGGDTEYCYALRLIGYKIWYDEALYFKHYMTNGRLNLKYLSRLRKAMSASNFVLRVYKDKLKNRNNTQKTFFNKLLEEVKSKGVKQLKRSIWGTFEEKEIAKEYFRNWYRFLFCYTTYNAHKRMLNAWLENRNGNK
ncbi:MAG: glycosyltransferase [Oceanihabitans sp.]